MNDESPATSHQQAPRYLYGSALCRAQGTHPINQIERTTKPVSFAAHEAAYKTLNDKLRPQVFTLGFLKN